MPRRAVLSGRAAGVLAICLAAAPRLAASANDGSNDRSKDGSNDRSKDGANDGSKDGWTVGQAARVRVDVKEKPRHDVSDGASVMRLEGLPDHRAIVSKTMEGTWRVVAYVPSAHLFVLGGQFEVGAWLPLNVISY